MAVIDVQLPVGHVWSNEWLPSLVGRTFYLEVTLPEGGCSHRPAEVIGAARCGADLGYQVIIKVELQ